MQNKMGSNQNQKDLWKLLFQIFFSPLDIIINKRLYLKNFLKPLLITNKNVYQNSCFPKDQKSHQPIQSYSKNKYMSHIH